MNSLKSKLISLLPSAAVMHLRALDHYINGEQELRILRGLVDQKRQAIDAGANIGTYSYFLRKYAAEVYAYEPNPELAARLRLVMPNIKVRQVALSDKPGEMTFSVPIDQTGRQRHELGSVAQTFSGKIREFPVKCITIDSESLHDVGFIKIDVEQHEREVIRGALGTIDACRPVILMEIYPLKYQQSVPKEFEFILQKNYCAWFSFAGRWLSLDFFRQDVHAVQEKFGTKDGFMGNNLVFFPNEHPRSKQGPKTK
jgi:FkbM family methyltransferase